MAKGKLQMTDNSMDKAELTKDRQYHGQRETDKRQQITIYSVTFTTYVQKECSNKNDSREDIY
jgi:hypothetical protein